MNGAWDWLLVAGFASAGLFSVGLLILAALGRLV